MRVRTDMGRTWARVHERFVAVGPPNEVRGATVRSTNLDDLSITRWLTYVKTVDHDAVTDLRFHDSSHRQSSNRHNRR